MVAARVKRALRGVWKPQGVSGAFDRTHNGLISGWFTCLACGVLPTPVPDLLIDGQPIDATKAITRRGDVPGGQGFVHRFARTAVTDVHVNIRCPAHTDHGLDLVPPADHWRARALAAIETSAWPHVTGWLALLDAREGEVQLVIDGYVPISVRTTLHRPDVQAYLGSRGVGGFQINLASSLGYAMPDNARIRLTLDGQVLAGATITGSPLGEDIPGCLPSNLAGDPLDRSTIYALRRRFRDTGVDTGGDWRDILDRLGQREYSPETEQWANYLAYLGSSPEQIAGWLALRATHSLGVPSLNPLPAELDQSVDSSAVEVSERQRSWTEPVLGLRDSATPSDELLVQETGQPTDVSEAKVVVAGLVHHRSGLGHNANNSLKALEIAGIHACAAPFFPAPGGWNQRLGPSSESIHSLADHTVLLHLPVDQVIPSLAAQPALLRAERLIGYFMWEMQTVPRQFHRALDLVDEIWTATDFVASAFRKVTDTPVHVTGHAVDVSAVETVRRENLVSPWTDFIVHFSCDANSTIARKNAHGAIRAFLRAFAEDEEAILLLRIRNLVHAQALARLGDPSARELMDLIGRSPQVKLIADELSYGEALGLIRASDCYMSLHRSEGFGYTIAEALALGVPVVAVGYSGLLHEGQIPQVHRVDFDMVDVLPGEYFFWEPEMLWADPSEAHAAELLQRVRSEAESSSRRTSVYEGFSMAQLSEKYVQGLARGRDRGMRRDGDFSD